MRRQGGSRSQGSGGRGECPPLLDNRPPSRWDCTFISPFSWTCAMASRMSSEVLSALDTLCPCVLRVCRVAIGAMCARRGRVGQSWRLWMCRCGEGPCRLPSCTDVRRLSSTEVPAARLSASGRAVGSAVLLASPHLATVVVRRFPLAPPLPRLAPFRFARAPRLACARAPARETPRAAARARCARGAGRGPRTGETGDRGVTRPPPAYGAPRGAHDTCGMGLSAVLDVLLWVQCKSRMF